MKKKSPTYVYAEGDGHHPRVLQNVAFECDDGFVGVCVGEEAGLRLGDEAVDASDVTRQRSHEERRRPIQEQGARQEYLNRCIAQSFASAGAARSEPRTPDISNDVDPYIRKATATITSKVKTPVRIA